MVIAMVMISSTIDPIEGVLDSMLSGKDGNKTKFSKNISTKKDVSFENKILTRVLYIY